MDVYLPPGNCQAVPGSSWSESTILWWESYFPVSASAGTHPNIPRAYRMSLVLNRNRGIYELHPPEYPIHDVSPWVNSWFEDTKIWTNFIKISCTGKLFIIFFPTGGISLVFIQYASILTTTLLKRKTKCYSKLSILIITVTVMACVFSSSLWGIIIGILCILINKSPRTSSFCNR